MDLGDWLLIETLGAPACWSVLAVGTAPRRWKSLARMVPGQVMPFVAAARATGEPIERVLPKSRHAWSEQPVRAIPIIGPGDCVHGVQLRVGAGSASPAPAAPYLFSNDNRRVVVASDGLGPDFDRDRSTWLGAEAFEYVERFDGALDWVTTIARGEPGSRWLGEMTVRSNGGLRTLMTAARNAEDNPQLWRGLLIDITDSVPPQAKSFEAATVDTLVEANPGLYLAVFDTEMVRVLRWISGPIPGLRWTGGTDERTMPHPDDLHRVRAARNDIRSGMPVTALPALRLAAADGGWLVTDVEVTPLPYGPPDGNPPRFALVRFQVAAQ